MAACPIFPCFRPPREAEGLPPLLPVLHHRPMRTSTCGRIATCHPFHISAVVAVAAVVGDGGLVLPFHRVDLEGMTTMAAFRAGVHYLGSTSNTNSCKRITWVGARGQALDQGLRPAPVGVVGRTPFPPVR